MRVGPLNIDPPLLLAPMAEVTDAPFRTICEELGAGFTFTEFVAAAAVQRGARQARARLRPASGGRPFGAQIFGRDPGALADAARLAHQAGAALVDINMGCPSRRVLRGDCGAALMREPELAAYLVRAVRDALPPSVPVSVKHRAGWDDEQRNAPQFAAALAEAGASLITVHGRTRSQGFSGTVDLEIIRRVRQAVPASVAVVGNGDVRAVDDYFRMREVTACDGVMIGRAAVGNPWLFRAIAAAIAGRADPGRPTIDERRATVMRHLELVGELLPSERHLGETRKAIARYSRGLVGGGNLRGRLFATFDLEVLLGLADEFFSHARPAIDRPSAAERHLARRQGATHIDVGDHDL